MGSYIKELIGKISISLLVIIIPCLATLYLGKHMDLLQGDINTMEDMHWDDIPTSFNNWISSVYASLSLLADLLIICSAVTFVHDKEEYGYIFIVLFAIGNLVRNVVILCINIRILMYGKSYLNDRYCQIPAFLISFAGLSVFWLMSTISIIIIAGSPPYRTCECVCLSKLDHFFKKHIESFWSHQQTTFIKIIFINITICTIFSVLPFFTGSYGLNGSSCGILKDASWLRFLSYYMHIMIAIILSIYTILRVLFLQKYSETPLAAIMDHNPPLQRSWHKFKTYPFVLILAFLIPFIRRTMTDYIGMDTDVYKWLKWIITIHRVTAGSFGFYIFLFHGRFGKCVSIHRKKYFGDEDNEDESALAASYEHQSYDSPFDTRSIGEDVEPIEMENLSAQVTDTNPSKQTQSQKYSRDKPNLELPINR